MLTWGISALSHDASVAVVDGGNIVFAAHAERYSRRKNDRYLHRDLIQEALEFGVPDQIAWYERPYLKKLRHLRAGQWYDAMSLADVPRRYMMSLRLPFALPPMYYVDHHESHAAAGVATSGFDEAAVIVADAIGEFDTFTIWDYRAEIGLRRIHSVRYPHSLGLLYSAFTRRCGFRPNEDEYIVMGMAAFGNPIYADHILEDLVEIREPGFRLRTNVHRGIGNWLPDAAAVDLAASVQQVTENIMRATAIWARQATGHRNLVLMGGVALNCVANSDIATHGGFDNMWIFPNPGDAGSSVGAAAAILRRPLTWPGPYLGTKIDRSVDPDDLARELSTTGVLALANGRAEFGPRALGNRSILADPRPTDAKDRVNRVKGRERFRPFAPVIRAELAVEYFDMPVPEAPYMQFTARCKRPDLFPAIAHVDGSSRVQTVTREQNALLYDTLKAWENISGCPMLLNTSLNSRSEPLVNTWDDAVRFSEREQIRVF